MTRSRFFVITDFECLDETSFTNRYQGAYMAGALETCPTTGTKHMQGVVYYENARTVASIGKRRKNNVEVARGSAADAIGYCAKGTRDKPTEGYGKFLEDPCEGFWEQGERPSQGKRTDLLLVANQVKEGRTVDDVALNDPQAFHNYGRTLERIEEIRLRQCHRTEMTKGLWLWGPTGVGKSHEAFDGYTPETHYVLNLEDNGWWEGYTGQATVIINDFRGQIRYGELLNLVDKWPHSVRRRNKAPMPFTSKLVIVTSSMQPSQIYHNLHAQDSLAQLEDRFEIRELSGGSKRHRSFDTEVPREGNTELPWASG